MPNGKEILDDLAYNEIIKKKNDRTLLEFIAQQTYGQTIRISSLTKQVSTTNRRSWENRISLLILIVALVCLGIINSNLLPLLGF